ncbi:MAG TPA: wax ester/triacylglycerol synthase family O-acyltransferase [Anaeromyxobacteraceae bacterium]|nr:wax ester/triacylglycerol synthase family O-acyltransferase [Anaeromyxobacteraceae bacterium]
MAFYERLSGLDATFLYIEDRAAHMHVGAAAVFEGRAPPYADLVALVRAKLDRVPRYRQRLAFVPLDAGRPVWVDEAHLDLEYHVRHTALPPPGGEEQLKRLAARVFASPLDRGRPLWEMWLVEGLAGDRFALLCKTHHCMIDGVSGADLAATLLDADPAAAPPTPAPFSPRPAPGRAALVAASLVDGVTHPLALARGALDAAGPPLQRLRQVAAGLVPLAALSRLGRAPASSLNAPIGPHRRFEMVSLDLAAVKAVRAALGGTVNDVLLAVVAGALRALLLARGEAPRGDLRAMVPVSVRGADGRGALGNQVSALFCPLPVGEPDSLSRLLRVARETRRLKESGQAAGTLAWTRLGDLAPAAVLAQVARFQSMHRYMNLVVTNIPGPREPLHLLGRRLAGWFPLVPLAQGQTIGIAIQSYAGRIGIGLVGDADRARDLPELARAIPEAMAELSALAAAGPGAASSAARA